jgi:hypothetical protein
MIREKVAERFGGSLARLAESLGKNRSTIWRWLTADEGVQFPKDPATFLSLAAALDVDPVMLLDWRPESFPWLCERISRTLRRRDWNEFLPSLGFLDEFLWPVDLWPPAEIAARFDRRWWLSNLWHNPQERRNYYALLLITPGTDRIRKPGRADPQVWHFGLRDAGAMLEGRMRPYGFITLQGRRLDLYHFNGISQSVELDEVPESFAVETWFGQGTSVHRVASLHSFDLRLVPSLDPKVPVVRFCHRGTACVDYDEAGPPVLCPLRTTCRGYRSGGYEPQPES